MKKVIWFLKENGKLTQVKVSDLIAYTSQDKKMKITEYDADNQTHKIVEFKN